MLTASHRDFLPAAMMGLMVGCLPGCAATDAADTLPAGPPSAGSPIDTAGPDGAGSMAERADMSALTGREWQVYQIGSRSAAGMAKITMNFSSTGRLHGSTGCNGYVTAYAADRDDFQIGNVTSSRKACTGPANELETGFMAALGRASVLRIDADGHLTLGHDGGVLLQAR